MRGGDSRSAHCAGGRGAGARRVGCRLGEASATPFKVAWIYVGPHNDGGWSQAHDDGPAVRPEDARQQGPDDLQGEHRRRRAVRRRRSQSLVAQGYKMIFATSYGYVDKAARGEVPERHVRAGDRDRRRARTCPSTSARPRTRSSCPGMAAGAASKNGNIGYVVAFPIPEVIRHANAFALGAQLTHPGATVHLVWTNSWYDPAKEKKAAQSLVAHGADVLGQNVDSPATGQYAESKGIPWVGYDSDALEVRAEVVADRGDLQLGRRTTSSASRRRWTGTWKPGFYYGSIKDGFTGLAPYRPGRERGDEGRDRREDEGDRERLVLRVRRARCTTRAASSGSRRA